MRLARPRPSCVGERDIDLAVEHRFDAAFDLVRQLVAVGTEQLDAVVMVGIVRGRDHHAEIRAQRARQHGHRGRRDRSEQKDIHAGRAEAGDHRVLQHVAGQPRVLADHHAVAVVAALERHAGSHADLHRHFRGHRKLVGAAANAVRSEIASRHCLGPGRWNGQRCAIKAALPNIKFSQYSLPTLEKRCSRANSATVEGPDPSGE